MNRPLPENNDFRSEVRPVEAGRQRGRFFFRRQCPSRGVIGHERQGRGFLIERVKPSAVGMESEMVRSGAGRGRLP